MKKVLTRALIAVAVLAASFGAFAGVSSANGLDYSTNPGDPTEVEQVPEGFVPLGGPDVDPNDDDCTVTTTQVYTLTRTEGYQPEVKETFTYGYKEKTRESFELFQKQVRTKTEQHKFRSRTWIENKKETKSVQGYRFVDGGTTRVNGETIGGHWERVNGQGRDDFYLIPDVIINIVWGPGGVPDQYLGEGSVNLSSYGGPSVTVRYQASAQDFSGWSDWGPWSDAQSGPAPADTDTRDYEPLPPAYGSWTNSGSPQQQKGADTDTEQWISAGTGYGDWSEWTEVTGLPERPERPRPDSPTYEWLELDPVSNNDGSPEVPGTNVTYFVKTVNVEKVDCKVAALTPNVNPSEECGVEGTVTLPVVEGVRYLLDGEVVEGVLNGPLNGTLTAEALPGFVLTTPFEFPVNLSAALECVTPFTPEPVKAGECGVADTIAIPETEGVQYLLDGEVIEAGIIEGPLSGLITAEALEGFELDTALYVEFDLAGAVDCPEETTTTTVVETTTTEKPEVSSTSVVKPQAAAEELAFTGSSSIVGTLLGAALLLMGAAVLFFGRRKTTD